MTFILCILDGWGYSEEQKGNAIFHAKTPHWDNLIKKNPSSFLKTDGESVGLPNGQMGNSEVGHTNIGAGRIVLQNLPRIDKAFKDNAISKNNDTPPKSAINYIKNIETKLEKINNASLATVMGRYYAMDRDQRWDRVEKAYNAIAEGKNSEKAFVYSSGEEAILSSYSNDETDEFISPKIVNKYKGMEDGDALIMANFRADRVREILSSFVNPNFKEFNRKKNISFSNKIGFVEYSKELNPFIKSLFPPIKIKNGLGEIIAKNELKQLRLAETEKYAHVTFFFNGGNENKYKNEKRILIQSPKVKTYDLKPEMSADEVTKNLIEAIETNYHDLIIVNYANPDMVGHTGIFDATIKAIETIDNCLGKIIDTVEKTNSSILITADHGNAEQTIDIKTEKAHTAHSCNVVPCVLFDPKKQDIELKNGCLADIAPTILSIMGIEKPIEMTGSSLL